MTLKRLNDKFEEVNNWRDARYAIGDDGSVEFLWEHDSAYLILTKDEIIKLAEILKDSY